MLKMCRQMRRKMNRERETEREKCTEGTVKMTRLID